jgi:hypothetical protein
LIKLNKQQNIILAILVSLAIIVSSMIAVSLMWKTYGQVEEMTPKEKAQNDMYMDCIMTPPKDNTTEILSYGHIMDCLRQAINGSGIK